MKNESRLQSAGILCSQDSVAVHHLRLGSGIPKRIRRFNGFIKAALTSNKSTIGVDAACLVALDAVLPSSLPRVESGLGYIYSSRGLYFLDWREDSPPRTERRALHARTMQVLSRDEVRDTRRDLALPLLNALQEFLNTQSPYAEFKAKERIRELELDALCWLYQCLPLPLFFHASGVQPLSAVSRACLASETSQLIPFLKDASRQENQDQMNEERCSELLDAMALSTGADANPILVRQALEHISLRSDESDAVAKRRWLGGLLGLRMAATRTGPISALMIAWAIDLIESGSIQQPNSPKKTLSTYLHKALEPLFLALSHLPKSDDGWDIDDLDNLYRSLISAEPPGSQKTMASALSNFHHFLQTWLDVPPLRKSLRADLALTEVKAIVIWPHQIDRALSWVDHVTDDARLAGAIRVTMHIAKEAPSRVSELANLRVGNVLDRGTYLEIEIAPSQRFGRLKSRAAQRRLHVSEPIAMEVIRDWKRQRISTGLGNSALFFGDPIKPDIVYRRAAMSSSINQLLKATTGDLSASQHSLRHSVISVSNEALLLTSPLGDINRFKETAVVAGHVTAGTSLLSYTHLYERPLRQYIDAALLSLVQLNSGEAGQVAGINGAALRQEAHRLQTDTSLFAWKKINESAANLPVMKAEYAFDWIEPNPPKKFVKSHANFGPSGTLLLLQYLAQGSPPSQVAASFLLDVDNVKRLNEIAIDHVVCFGSRIWIRKYPPASIKPSTLGDALNQFGFDLREADHAKFDSLHTWLQDHHEEKLLDDAVHSWADCRTGDYLDLALEYSAAGIYQLLATAGTSPALLRVCIRGQSLAQINSALMDSVQRDFVAAFGIRPKLQLVKPRLRVAQAYLQFDSDETKDRPHASSGSIRGLDALMLTTAVHLAWTREVQA